MVMPNWESSDASLLVTAHLENPIINQVKKTACPHLMIFISSKLHHANTKFGRGGERNPSYNYRCLLFNVIQKQHSDLSPFSLHLVKTTTLFLKKNPKKKTDTKLGERNFNFSLQVMNSTQHSSVSADLAPSYSIVYIGYIYTPYSLYI